MNGGQSGTVGMWTDCRVLIVNGMCVSMFSGDVGESNGRCTDRYGGHVDRL
jgi:hypothetical protein